MPEKVKARRKEAPAGLFVPTRDEGGRTPNRGNQSDTRQREEAKNPSPAGRGREPTPEDAGKGLIRTQTSEAELLGTKRRGVPPATNSRPPGESLTRSLRESFAGGGLRPA